jgi:hypothetical protein
VHYWILALMSSSNPRIQSSRNHIDYTRTAAFLTLTLFFSFLPCEAIFYRHVISLPFHSPVKPKHSLRFNA